MRKKKGSPLPRAQTITDGQEDSAAPRSWRTRTPWTWRSSYLQRDIGQEIADANHAVRRRRLTCRSFLDLLKPGFEILVQIAKEPIAEKGARITSHIALPGRFLVFMPTVSAWV